MTMNSALNIKHSGLFSWREGLVAKKLVDRSFGGKRIGGEKFWSNFFLGEQIFGEKKISGEHFRL